MNPYVSQRQQRLEQVTKTQIQLLQGKILGTLYKTVL